eukprot:CAMPEP_0172694942 /NCGR_PEP_ID=MMETSP1074-20121228/27013_1 /TAXON_ID=2916 /ORGANISM="Ceratium fusus, Strain PA161109" /LENGTH=183 /DNA_ID=CAMNT_0013515495 /DNA_START=178 /DNA_END=729 /DNA_ORIENTATION=+
MPCSAAEDPQPQSLPPASLFGAAAKLNWRGVGAEAPALSPSQAAGLKEAFLAGAVWAGQAALALHASLAPLPDITAAVSEPVATAAIHLVVGPLAFVTLFSASCVMDFVNAITVLAACKEFARVHGAILPRLCASTRFEIQKPLSIVGGCIKVQVPAIAMLQVSFPLTCIATARGISPHTMAV